MMTLRSLAAGVLALVTVSLTGCGSSNTVQAIAPASNHRMSAKAPSDGRYTLYRAWDFDDFGKPHAFKTVASYNLRRGDPLGFQWINDRDKQFDRSAALQLEAYAGQNRQNLGPITGVDEKYFWSDSDEGGGYWQAKANGKVFRTVTLQD